LSNKGKPKYGLDKDGYVMFYYHKLSCWEYFPLWNSNVKERILHVHDRVRNLDYDISYDGPGRTKWKLIFDDTNLVPQDFITDYMRKIHPEIENSETLWTLYNLYINKENTILNKIIKDHIFKAHECNQ
jgi:hypothetical protein